MSAGTRARVAGPGSLGAPPNLSLLPQQFFWDYLSSPGKIWAGVPTSVDPTGRVLVLDTAVTGGPGGSVPGGGIVVAPGGSIQAAFDALPATGGVVMLSANTTYVLTTGAVSAKPNVTLRGSGWGTVIQRAASLRTGMLVSLTGAGSIVENITVDGNNVVPTNYGAYSELSVTGANGVARGCQIINCRGTISLTLAGANAKALFNTITGPGVDLGLETGYGIWALNGDTVHIEGNVVTNTCIDGIGYSGPGSRAVNNRISNCHLYAGNGGGQLAYYGASLSGTTAMGLSQGNYIGATPLGDGIEVSGKYFISDGDEIESQGGYGIHVTGTSGQVVLVNGIIRNVAMGTGNHLLMDGVSIAGGVSDLKIHNMKIVDDQATKTMRACIAILAGSGDNIVITNNNLGPTGLAFPMTDGSTGLNKIIENNLGIDNVLPTIAISGGTIAPLWNPMQLVNTVGTVTSIQGTLWQNRPVKLFSGAGAVVYQAGSGNIMNTVTCAVNTFKEARYLNGNWYFQA